MSNEQGPEQTPPAGGTSLRRLIRMAGAMVGRSTEPESPGETADTQIPESEPGREFDTAETSLADAARGPEDEQEPLRTRFPARFTVQRPVIYSGTRAGFFESEKAQSLLLSMREEADFPVVPHVTIAQRALIGQIMARRQGVPVNMIASECRQVVDELPDRRYAQVTGAKTMDTTAVMLDLNWEGRGSLLKDVRRLCEHFDIPFDTEHRAAYYPHVTVMWAPGKDKAAEMAGQLDELINDTEPQPTAIGFGGPTVLVGRASS